MTGEARAPQGVFLEASAGTGKTTALVDAMAGAIEDGLLIDRIAAVTFTHQAAGEMKLRLRQKLDLIASDRSQAAVQSLDKAFIGTIHGFCANLIRRRPVEARVDPSFQEMDEGQSRRMFSDVFRRWLEHEMTSIPPGLKRALSRLSWMDSPSGPIDKLRDAAWQLAEWRDHPQPWERRALDRENAIDSLRNQLASTLDVWPIHETTWARNILAEILNRIRSLELAGTLDSDEVESDLISISKLVAKASLRPRSEAAEALSALKSNVKEYARSANPFAIRHPAHKMACG